MADPGLWVGSDGVFGDAAVRRSQGHPRVGGGGYAAIRWIFGRRFLRICQRSYSACIVSHERAVILRNAANRIANSGVSPYKKAAPRAGRRRPWAAPLCHLLHPRLHQVYVNSLDQCCTPYSRPKTQGVGESDPCHVARMSCFGL